MSVKNAPSTSKREQIFLRAPDLATRMQIRGFPVRAPSEPPVGTLFVPISVKPWNKLLARIARAVRRRPRTK